MTNLYSENVASNHQKPQAEQCEPPTQGRPRVTVAAIVERQGHFLMVEEHNTDGELVINQPAGHVEMGESLLEAVIRETLEETARHFIPDFLVGVYLWKQPQGCTTFLRVCFSGQVGDQENARALDHGIVQTLWLSRDDLQQRTAQLRSPLVLKTVDDYLAGERYPLSILKSLIESTA